MLFKRPARRAFKYKPVFYKLPDEQETENSKRRITFDRFPREMYRIKSAWWYIALLGMVLYMMYMLNQYK